MIFIVVLFFILDHKQFLDTAIFISLLFLCVYLKIVDLLMMPSSQNSNPSHEFIKFYIKFRNMFLPPPLDFVNVKNIWIKSKGDDEERHAELVFLKMILSINMSTLIDVMH